MVRPDFAGHPDYTGSVPTELLLYLLSTFNFDELLPLLAVSRRWRAVALDSEPYWSFIRLESLTAAATNLFVTRISRTKERPVALNVNIKPNDADDSDSSSLQATVLSALREHLHHIYWLLIYLRGSDVSALWLSLSGPASQLRYISLRSDLLPAEERLPVVPASLFAGVSPLLRSVTLVDIDLPEQPLSVFSKVTKLTMLYGAVRVVPDLFHHFPSLETIDLPSDASFANPAFHTERSYMNIKDCIWRSGRGVHNYPVPLAPTRHVEIVTIYNPRAEEIRRLIDHLKPPLRLRYAPGIEYPEDEFELCFSELEDITERCRVIVDETVCWEQRGESELRRGMATALSGKLHTMDVDAAQWQSLARCMPAFQGLQRLQINIEDEGDVAALSRAGFPSRDFRTLALAAPQCMWVPERDIIDFAVASFDPMALGETTLVLRNIHPRGSPRRFSDMFKETKVVHDTPCRFPRRRPQAQS